MLYAVVILAACVVGLCCLAVRLWRQSFHWERQSYKWRLKYEHLHRAKFDHDWWRETESSR